MIEKTLLMTAGVLLGLAAAPSARAAEDDPPLSLARDGFFYVGGKNTMVDGHTYVVGQMYVEMRIPLKQTHPFPIIMVHGGTRTGTTFTGTPDGRESWAQYFARRGYAVYVVDQPGRGRSGYLSEAYGAQSLADGESGQRRYLQQEKFKLWPQAHLHTQWPGSGAPDDPVTLQMTGSYVPEMKDFAKAQLLNRDALVALLDKIGPSIIMVHSQAGAFAWPVADARPDLVKAIVGVEPNGPPVHSVELVGAPDCLGRSAHLRSRRQGRRRVELREGRQGRCARFGDLLEAGGAGTATSQFAENADHGDDLGGVLSRPL
jgi:pimeloyl-ACP methyl ester carboxylesterase